MKNKTREYYKFGSMKGDNVSRVLKKNGKVVGRQLIDEDDFCSWLTREHKLGRIAGSGSRIYSFEGKEASASHCVYSMKYSNNGKEGTFDVVVPTVRKLKGDDYKIQFLDSICPKISESKVRFNQRFRKLAGTIALVTSISGLVYFGNKNLNEYDEYLKVHVFHENDLDNSNYLDTGAHYVEGNEVTFADDDYERGRSR